ncbi:MAG: ACP S-malonyltransferase [Thermomicrobiales bacterium]|nr:ACP S-malonyltransferase [Thermomicrobiales bacterium]MCO5219489.1 ACP S-malonyltransferase [Thermomicrobiales bacterium]MCO5224897.1 ACP S-malonyltransferase [Thermomicrobiales bacterium]MCO5228461.1 ACP S-malonyltransferase [Thermomicrobiales bacterium]
MSIMDRLGTSYAFVFPGQGSQSIGMGESLVEHSKAAKEMLDSANETLGFDLGHLMFNGPEDELADTRNSQPAIYTCSAMALAALSEKAKKADAYLAPNMVAGHSLGEFTALLAADVFDFTTGLKLVAARGEYMADAGAVRPGAMAAVLGLDDDKLAELVNEAARGDVLTMANLNCPGQIVVSGEVAPMDRFEELAKAAGARRVARLPISIASHSDLMAPAAEQLNALFDEETLYDPSMPVIANSTGLPLTTASEIREELRTHVIRGVNWTATIQTMASAGITTLIELGNGNVLAGLNKRIDKSLTTLSLKDLGLAES